MSLQLTLTQFPMRKIPMWKKDQNCWKNKNRPVLVRSVQSIFMHTFTAFIPLLQEAVWIPTDLLEMRQAWRKVRFWQLIWSQVHRAFSCAFSQLLSHCWGRGQCWWEIELGTLTWSSRHAHLDIQESWEKSKLQPVTRIQVHRAFSHVISQQLNHCWGGGHCWWECKVGTSTTCRKQQRYRQIYWI